MSAPSPVESVEPLKRRLAGLRGIGEAYFDHRGELHYFSAETRDRLLLAMGCDLHDPAGLEREIESLESARWRALLPRVAVLRRGRMGVALEMPATLLDAELRWQVRLEDGGSIEGTARGTSLEEGERREIGGVTVSRRLLVLADTLPAGYHVLRVALATLAPSDCALIVAPTQCFEPAELRSGRRVWGVAAQLYALVRQHGAGNTVIKITN